MIILSVVATDRKTIRSDTTMLPLLVSSDSIRQVNIPIVFFCMLVQCCVVTFFPPEKKQTNKQTNANRKETRKTIPNAWRWRW